MAQRPPEKPPTAQAAGKAAARKPLRKRGLLPPGLQLRDGRPRWFADGKLRAAGWKGVDLRDDHGQWLARGPAVARADQIADAVRAWRKDGTPPPAWMAAFAPVSDVMAAPGAAHDGLAIGVLADAFLDSREFKSRAASTQRDYRGKLGRLLDALCGFAALPASDDAAGVARHARQLAALRASSIMTLEPYEAPGEDVFAPLYNAYWALHAAAGVHQASGVLAVASVWLSWINKHKRRKVQNWAKEVSRETPAGRIRPCTLPELKALVAAADGLGLPEVGDAIVISFDLSWSQIDVLALDWDSIESRAGEGVGGERAFTGLAGRKKTGRVGGTPFTFIGRARLEQIRKRQAAEKVTPLKVRKVVQLKRSKHTKRGPDADSHFLRKLFAQVRDEAVKSCASCADITFADLRDTAVTFSRNAGLNDDQLASRTLQSRKNIANLHDKHYGEIGPEIADQGLALLEAHYRKLGIAL